jgi:outer membrane protein assembly factor BamB
MCRRFLTAVVTCFTVLVVTDSRAQEVVTSYADSVGSIVRRNIATGSIVSSTQRIYRVGYSNFYPTRIAYDGTFYYVVFGNRYLAQLRPADGSIVWIIDASVMVAYVRYPVLDLAVAGGSIFVCTNDPAGRIMKYRAGDGALLWTIQAGVQSGYVIYTPIRLGAAGTDSFYVALGGMFLARLRQSDGGVVWRKSIPLTYALTTWGVADLTASGGGLYVANVDPNGTLRKFSTTDGALLWTKNPFYQLLSTKYLTRIIAGAGTDTVMVLFGYRYLGRLRASDATSVWTIDVGLTTGAITEAPTDMAAVPSP